MKIPEEEACKIFGIETYPDVRLNTDELLEAPFELTLTTEFFIDYNLPCNNDAEGDWGITRRLYNAEYIKYGRKFSELLEYRIVIPDELRLVEYCWYDCSEAKIILTSQLITMTFMMRYEVRVC